MSYRPGLRTRLLLRIVVAALVYFGHQSVCDAYQLSQIWTDTATGSSGPLGSPVILTWSIVPDSTGIPQLTGSNLVATLDQYFGGGPGGSDYTLRPWFPLLDGAFQRWSELSGVRFQYEPRDDGLTHSSFPGILNERGDIRLAGTYVDGEGGYLGYSFRPNNGDIVLDTSEVGLLANPANNFLSFRNLLMHEAGHSLGLAHVDSSDASFLMEAFFSTAFDGPQIDDIRGVHRAYGDVLERSHQGAGNGSAANAYDLGILSDLSTAAKGGHGGPDALVLATDTEFLSIDDDLDADFFAFTVTTASLLDVQLTPVGPVYNQGPRGGQQNTVNGAAVSDLTLALLAADGSTTLRLVNNGGLGQPESLVGWSLPDAGTYFIRVTGSANDVQMYQFQLRTVTVPEPRLGTWTVLCLLITWFGHFRCRVFAAEGNSTISV